ncbi:MAG: hypothetical protein ACEQSX_16565, partial [Baekduiaceae bacterium]
MSDSYMIGDVTITPSGGGYYDLTHESLDGAERVRGKEAADARAVEISTPKTNDDNMTQQGGIDVALQAAEQGARI